MASTFIKRIVAPWELTPEEIAAVDAEVPTAVDEEYKLPVMPVVDVADQIIRGRLPNEAMLNWITAAEKVDADELLRRITHPADPTLSLDEFERLLRAAERAVFTWQQVEAFLGMS